MTVLARRFVHWNLHVNVIIVIIVVYVYVATGGGKPATARGQLRQANNGTRPAAASLRAHYYHYVKPWGFLNYGPVI
ncbi:MAG: hypothetical protein ACKPKO_24715 [Candidatus Fonsibacter sp.]